jgi:spore coat-associated protein N
MKHSLAQPRRATTRTKAIVSGGLIALTAAGVGGAAFAAFTATSTASQAQSSGTMSFADISASAAGQRLSVDATNIAPNDTIQRAVTLENTGSIDMLSASLTTVATTTSALDTDATNGLQMVVDQCSVPWTESAFPYVYTCGGTTTTVVASRPVIGSGVALPGIDTTAGAANHLRVTLTFPGTAGNTLQDLDSVIDFTFDGVQRAGIPQ